MRVVMLGLPGAGKGTQGELLAKKYGVPHISTGSMFRAAIDSNTELGQEARIHIDRGELVPDDLTLRIVLDRLSQEDCADGFVLDGFPRTVPQARALDEKLPQLGMHLNAAINIAITEASAIRRIAERLVCSQCGHTYHRTFARAREQGVCDVCGGPLVQRKDDTEETARHRLRVYLDQTHPVIDYYRSRGILISVDGEQSIPAVFNEICQRMSLNGRGGQASGVLG